MQVSQLKAHREETKYCGFSAGTTARVADARRATLYQARLHTVAAGAHSDSDGGKRTHRHLVLPANTVGPAGVATYGGGSRSECEGNTSGVSPPRPHPRGELRHADEGPNSNGLPYPIQSLPPGRGGDSSYAAGRPTSGFQGSPTRFGPGVPTAPRRSMALRSVSAARGFGRSST